MSLLPYFFPRSGDRCAHGGSCHQRLCAGRGAGRAADRGAGGADRAAHLAGRLDGPVRPGQWLDRPGAVLSCHAGFSFSQRSAAWRLFRRRHAGGGIAGHHEQARPGQRARIDGADRGHHHRRSGGELAGAGGRLALVFRHRCGAIVADGHAGRALRAAPAAGKRRQPAHRTECAQEQAGLADLGDRRHRLRRIVHRLYLSRRHAAGRDACGRKLDPAGVRGVRVRHDDRPGGGAAFRPSQPDESGGLDSAVVRRDLGALQFHDREYLDHHAVGFPDRTGRRAGADPANAADGCRGEAQTLAAALNHSAFNVANALGPLVGGIAIAHGLGLSSAGLVGAGLALGGLAIWGIARTVRPDPHK